MNLHQLQQRNQELSILNAIAQDLNRTVELEKALDATLRQAVHLLHLRTGWIWLMNAETGSAYVAAAHNLPPIFSEKPELLTGWCYCIEKYLTGEMEATANISEITCTRLKELREGTDGLRFHASVPLLSGEEKIGIMNVLSADSQKLTDSQLQLLHTIGDMLGIAIQRAKLFKNSRQLGILEERNRLAREMHDTLAQGLSGISLRLETVQALLENGQVEKAGKQIEKTLDLTKLNIEDARRSVLDLRATPLQENNLVEALEKMVGEFSEREKINGTFEVLGKYAPQSMRTELGLFRIAQEAVQNILKHAEATKFYVKIIYENDDLTLAVEDDGKGFLPTQATDGFGLIGISERVHILGGKLEVESELGEGTRLTVTRIVNP